MFISEKELKLLRIKIDMLEQDVLFCSGIVDSFVYCEKCGCLLDKQRAFKGKSEVGEKDVPIHPLLQTKDSRNRKIEYIHYPYYCKIHKPVEKDVKK